MSTEINSINYQFNPDRHAQTLCESIVTRLEGNTVQRSDIIAVTARNIDVTITTKLNWKVVVSLKSKSVAGKHKKNTKYHKTVQDAQTMAKKQGHHILRNSLGKIELVKNIEADPGHYFKHSTVKLNGGPGHGFLAKCSQGCSEGSLVCPRCEGKGTHKAQTKKEDFLGTSGNFAVKNTCPQCHGKGKIDCPTCEGSGLQSLLYNVEINASQTSTDSVDTDAHIKPAISEYLNRISHEKLLKQLDHNEIIELKDIDDQHCSVSYKSSAKAVCLTISVAGKNYEIIGFGKNNNIIHCPAILDDILPVRVNKILGISPALNSRKKYNTIESIRVLEKLLPQDFENLSDKSIGAVITSYEGLITAPALKQTIDLIKPLKKHQTPRFSFYAWLPFVVAGTLAALYLALAQRELTENLRLIGVILILTLGPGYLLSRQITNSRRRKQKLKPSKATYETLPAILSVFIISGCYLLPKTLENETRWSVYLSLHGVYQKAFFNYQSGTGYESTRMISSIQKQMITLGYKDIVINGEYNIPTDNAIKDFQRKMGITSNVLVDVNTLNLATEYAHAKKKYFSD